MTSISADVDIIFISAIAFLALIYGVIWCFVKKRAQINYALFLGSMALFFALAWQENNWTQLVHYTYYPVQFLAFYFYLKFTKAVLNTEKNAMGWHKVIEFFTKTFMVMIPLFLGLQYFFGKTVTDLVNFLLAPVFTVFAIMSYVVFAKFKGNHVIYFILGSVVFVGLADLSLLIEATNHNHFIELFKVNPVFLFEIGVLIESLFTAMLFAVQWRDAKAILKHTKQQLLTKNKEGANLQMVALQSQMDPHFLYNSLNSINNFVLTNNPEKASDYITKFSRLIREILNNSSQVTISLEKELGILSLYVKLEQMRMQEGFDYLVEIEDTIDLDQIEVPPLFLQPFVENAIWHGIANQKENKHIKLCVFDEGSDVRIELIDNGIGIDQSLYHNSYLDKNRKSFGVKATEDRIKLLHNNEKVYLVIEDLASKNLSGTKVTIKFPKKRITID